MTEPGDGRVAVYIDFDNIVISRYDQVHGRSQFMRDRAELIGAHLDVRSSPSEGTVVRLAIPVGTVRR